MDLFISLWNTIRSLLPTGFVVLVIAVVVVVMKKLLGRQLKTGSENQVKTQIVLFAVSLVGLVMVILTLPIGDSTQSQLLSLIGIVLSAAIALSSTTFVGNAFAGMMLRTVGSFHPGDFIRVNDYFGRVSDRGLFHTEIQTEDRDLTTLPNLYLVTNPVKVIRTSGTIISGEVSLGYDVPHGQVEESLKAAAVDAKLEDPYVYVMKLGDFSVTYRVTGLLKEVKRVISSRSHLYREMLDHLHRDGVEIVSPTFMNQRKISEHMKFMAPSGHLETKGSVQPLPESIAFDKAEEAESIEKLRLRLSEVEGLIKEAKEKIEKAESDEEKQNLGERCDVLEGRKQLIIEIIRKREAE